MFIEQELREFIIFKYLDSYIGDIDVINEETVWYNNEPVWGMNGQEKIHYKGKSINELVIQGCKLKTTPIRRIEESNER